MRICYFGKYDPTYSRDAVIRKGLALQKRVEKGHSVERLIATLTRLLGEVTCET